MNQNAYKAQAEGKAALVTAWMPLIRMVALVGFLAFAHYVLGVDFAQFQPMAEIKNVTLIR
ncbi:hypothetical protein CVD28_11685 [Bacillus sp. M6-12]|nr:hypothetical protein CVD28_11685 [Bacillus sp. M6-12]